MDNIEADSPILHKLKKYKQKLNDASGKKRKKTLLKLRRLLVDSKDDELFVKQLTGIVDQTFVTDLLVSYNATLEENDKHIFEILYHLERTYHLNIGRLTPIVFGQPSKENYENLRRLGQTLHTRLTSDQVLDFLDRKLMWSSLLNFSDSPYYTSQKSADQIYDCRFILRLLASLLDAGAELSCRKFIEQNALSFTFAATSLHSKINRALAYLVLERFLQRLLDLSTENFLEKSLYVYVLTVFRNSIERANERIPHVVSHFFARLCKLILHPEDPLYQPILSFLILKPTIDLTSVPEFYKLLMSSSTHHNQEERHWILKLVADSMIEPNDYNILQKSYGIKYCLSFFGSCISDSESRKYILFMLSSALRHPSVAHDLFHRQNLQCWITATIQDPSFSAWEVRFLCQIFLKLLEHFVNNFSKDSDQSSDLSVAASRNVCQMLSKKVLEVLQRVNGEASWCEKLEAFINATSCKN